MHRLVTTKMFPFSEAEGLITRQASMASNRPHILHTHQDVWGKMSLFSGAAAQYQQNMLAFFDYRPLCSVYSLRVSAILETGF